MHREKNYKSTDFNFKSIFTYYYFDLNSSIYMAMVQPKTFSELKYKLIKFIGKKSMLY